MLDKNNKLDISQEELAVIEAALHTQSKILTVQAGAGGAAARVRLNEVKRLIKRVSRSSPKADYAAPRGNFLVGWFGRSRTCG